MYPNGINFKLEYDRLYYGDDYNYDYGDDYDYDYDYDYDNYKIVNFVRENGDSSLMSFDEQFLRNKASFINRVTDIGVRQNQIREKLIRKRYIIVYYYVAIT